MVMFVPHTSFSSMGVGQQHGTTAQRRSASEERATVEETRGHYLFHNSHCPFICPLIEASGTGSAVPAQALVRPGRALSEGVALRESV